VQGVKASRDGLPVLGDYLEEKFGLPATAALFRRRDLKELPGGKVDAHGFSFFPLTDDVFIYFSQARVPLAGKPRESGPCHIVGLYAHPREDAKHWARVSGMVPAKDDPESQRERPWAPDAQPDPGIEAARKELAAHAKPRGK